MKQVQVYINRWLLAVLMTGVFFTSQAQVIDYAHADSITYQNYLDHNWKALIANGKLALKNNIDYYYLRMRMGEAYYAQEKYALAISQLKKALAFNHQEKLASALLYEAYLQMGTKGQAYRLGMSFNKNLQQSLGVKARPVELIDVYGGYTFSNNGQKNGQTDILGPQDDFGQQTLIGNQVYLHAGLMLHVVPSYSLYLSGSYLKIEKTSRFQYNVNKHVKGIPVFGQDGWILNRYYLQRRTYNESFSGYISQFEFYVNNRIFMNNGWALHFYGNLLSIRAPIVDNYHVLIGKTDTLAWQPSTGAVQTTTWIEDGMVFNQTDTSFVNWVAGIDLEKDFSMVNIHLFGTISQLGNSNQGQLGLSLFYYPLGSTSFYGKTEFIGFFESGDTYNSQNRVIFNQLLGVKVFKNTWLEGEYLTGDLHNANMKQGLVVYNLPEKINFIVGMNLHVFVKNHLEISLIYNYADKENRYKTSQANDQNETYNTLNYQTQSIIGGLKWTF